MSTDGNGNGPGVNRDGETEPASWPRPGRGLRTHRPGDFTVTPEPTEASTLREKLDRAREQLLSANNRADQAEAYFRALTDEAGETIDKLTERVRNVETINSFLHSELEEARAGTERARADLRDEDAGRIVALLARCELRVKLPD